MRHLQSIARFIAWLEVQCISWSVLALAAVTIANVCARTFGASFLAAEEICRFLMVGITFIGLGYAAGQGRHVRMTALYDALPRRARKGVMLLISFATSALCAYLAWLSLAYVLHTVRPLGAVSPVLQVPTWRVYLVAPVGFALAAVQYALAFARNLAGPEVYLSFTHADAYDAALSSPDSAL